MADSFSAPPVDADQWPQPKSSVSAPKFRIVEFDLSASMRALAALQAEVKAEKTASRRARATSAAAAPTDLPTAA